MDGVKASSPTETMSTMVLKNEFKKMMRETRAENLKTIRVSHDMKKLWAILVLTNSQGEQEERRRLEGIIKGLKRDLQQTNSRKDIGAVQNGGIEAR